MLLKSGKSVSLNMGSNLKDGTILKKSMFLFIKIIVQLHLYIVLKVGKTHAFVLFLVLHENGFPLAIILIHMQTLIFKSVQIKLLNTCRNIVVH